MVDQAKAKMPSPDDVQNNQSVQIVTNAKARVEPLSLVPSDL
jgi:hypothetical protein